MFQPRMLQMIQIRTSEMVIGQYSFFRGGFRDAWNKLQHLWKMGLDEGCGMMLEEVEVLFRWNKGKAMVVSQDIHLCIIRKRF